MATGRWYVLVRSGGKWEGGRAILGLCTFVSVSVCGSIINAEFYSSRGIFLRVCVHFLNRHFPKAETEYLHEKKAFTKTSGAFSHEMFSVLSISFTDLDHKAGHSPDATSLSYYSTITASPSSPTLTASRPDILILTVACPVVSRSGLLDR